MATEPEYDRDEVIKRLIAEQSQTGQTLEKIRKAVDSDPEFQGLSLEGGVRTIIRRYKEVQDKNLQLEKELNRMILKGKK